MYSYIYCIYTHIYTLYAHIYIGILYTHIYTHAHSVHSFSLENPNTIIAM